nr:triphosphoribosyl-dephospho-CoA synthase CitG [uncultured Cohaesibacter sp.]
MDKTTRLAVPEDAACAASDGMEADGSCSPVLPQFPFSLPRLSSVEPLGRPVSGGEELADRLAHLVHEALVIEATLTPKPGLVDGRNDGAHKDMTLATFLASAAALRPHLAAFVTAGVKAAFEPAADALLPLRAQGIVCEEAMNTATAGVNTHKGGIFAFGLLLGAAGRCHGRGGALTVEALCAEVALLADGLVGKELACRRRTASTAGEYIYRRYGLTGARGEAESGFALARHCALPAYLAARRRGQDGETALLAALLELLIHNRDTNLVARGGIDGLTFVRNEAVRLKRLGGVSSPDFIARLMALDEAMIDRNLSPGGSADLLAVTWFLAQLGSFGLDGRGGLA